MTRPATVLLGGSLVDCGQGRMAGGLAQASWHSLGPLKAWMRLILSCSAGSHSGWSLLATHQPRLFPVLPTPLPLPAPSQDSETVLCGSQNQPVRTEGVQSTVAEETSSAQHPLWVKGRPALSTGVCPLWLTLRTSYGFSSPFGSETPSSSMAQVPTMVYAYCSHYFHSLT